MNSTAMNSSDNPWRHYATMIKSITGIWCCIAMVVGCPLNLLAAKCAWKYARTRNHALLYQWFVFSMCIADFLYLGIVMPMQFLEFEFRMNFPSLPCYLKFIVNHSTTVASSLNLLALNFDKFLAIFRPLGHYAILNGTRVWVTVTASWLISMAWGLVFTLSPITVYRNQTLCAPEMTSYSYYLSFAIVFFLAPTALATVFSVIIAIIVKKQLTNFDAAKKASVEDRNSQHDSINIRKNSRSASNAHCIRHRDSFSRAKKITFVFTTTFWSCCTCLPYRIAYTIFEKDKSHLKDPKRAAILGCTMIFLIANAVGNPCIAILSQRRFRQDVKEMWTKFCKCCTKNTTGHRHGSTRTSISEIMRRGEIDKEMRMRIRTPLLRNT